MTGAGAADGLGSVEAVAALLLMIDADRAARILQSMEAVRGKRVMAAMEAMRDEVPGRDAVFRVLAAAMERLERVSPLGDVAKQVEDLRQRAGIHSEPAAESEVELDQLASQQQFAMFETLVPRDLAKLLADEHPQIAAVFLAHLKRATAAAVLRETSPERRADLVYRVAILDRTPEVLVQRVLSVMELKATELGLTTKPHDDGVFIKAAAEILNRLDDGDQRILADIRATHPDIAGSIRDQMFRFEDIAQLDRKAVQSFLGMVDTKTLATALRGAPDGVTGAVFSNLTKRAVDMVRDQRDRLGPMRISQVESAREVVLRAIRGLIDRGVIPRVGADREPVV